MSGSSSSSLLEGAAIFLTASVVAVPLFRKLRLGSILGYLAAGIAIGPHGLGLLGDPEGTMHVAELGVVLFLFLIGLELEVSRLWAMRRDIFGVGTAQLLVTAALAMLFPLLVGGASWQASLVCGLGLALSSTALVMQMLQERGEVQSPHGQKAFAILLMQDLAIVPLLALVAFLAPRAAVATGAETPMWLGAAKMLGALAAVVLAGRYALNPFFRVLAATGAREIMTAAALLVVIAAAMVMTYAGLSAALGAFLAGILLAESSYRHELEADVEPFRGLLLGLFFVSVGMTVDPSVLAQAWKLLLAELAVLTLIKVGVVYGLVRLSSRDHAAAVRAALLLPQGGEFAFVLFATAAAAGVMTPDHATRLVALVTLSMALTPLLGALTPLLLREEKREREESFDGVKGTVLLIGFGRFGQVLSQMLLLEGIAVTAIDNDLEMIEVAERFGFKVYFGDGTRLDVLRAAGAERARLICVCVERPATASRIVELSKASFPLAQVYARSFDRVHALELLDKGADFQIRETYESAIAFGRQALLGLDLAPERVLEIDEEVRLRDAERFALQQQGGVRAGVDRFITRPTPRPAPLVPPRQPGVALNPNEIARAEAEEAEEAEEARDGANERDPTPT